LGEFHYE